MSLLWETMNILKVSIFYKFDII